MRRSSSLYGELLEHFPLLSEISGEVYVVGGAVRDVVMGIAPFEADLSARNARDVAAAFATATRSRLVDMGRERFTTFRVVTGRGEYDFSEIEGSLEADIRRRDCTMNAIAVSVRSGEVIDQVDGIADARRRLIRLIDEKNYIDDPLRIVKLVRLAVTRDCTIEPGTMDVLRRHASRVDTVAVERVQAELKKMLDDSRAGSGIELLRDLSLDRYLFGGTIDDDALQRVRTLLESDSIARFAALTWNLAASERRALVEKFKWSDAARREFEATVALTLALREGIDADVLLHEAGETIASRALLLLGAVGEHEASFRIARLLKEHPELFTMKALLTGSEIQEYAALPAGREIGRLKRALLVAQLRGEVTSRDSAIAFVKRA